MKISYKYVAVLLLIAGVNLAVMIPGGPIETRDFSHIAPVILGVFNIFLTVLGMGSFALIYFVLRHKTWAIRLAFLAGIGYTGVYLLDLFQIFPKSPIAMPALLTALEIFGTVIAIPLMVTAYMAIFYEKCEVNSESKKLKKGQFKKIVMIVLTVIFGGGIVVFATLSAMFH